MNLDRAIRSWNHRRIDRMREFKLWLAHTLFSSFSKIVPTRSQDSILVLRLDGKLGDSVVSTGFLRELKKANPQSRLVVVASSAGAAVYRNLGFIDQVFVTEKGIFKTLALYLRLKGDRYKYVINTSHILNPRVLFLCSLISATRKVTISNLSYKLFSDHIEVDFKKDHITDRYLKILRALDIDSSNLKYEMNIGASVDREAHEYILNLRQNYRWVIALNSFAGAHLRNLDQSRTIAIVKKLILNPDVVVISLANEGDHRLLNRWIDLSYSGRWIHLDQFSSLESNFAVLKHSDLLITPDTAWVHLASVLSKNLVAIYREDRNPNELNSVAWAPLHKNARIIKAHSPLGAPENINDVNVDEVVQAAFSFLQD